MFVLDKIFEMEVVSKGVSNVEGQEFPYSSELNLIWISPKSS